MPSSSRQTSRGEALRFAFETGALLVIFTLAGCAGAGAAASAGDPAGGAALTVYVGGYSDDSSGVAVPGYWKNGAWVELPTLSASYNSVVQSLVVSGSDIYAGGYSTNEAGEAIPGYWKDGVWFPLPSLDPSDPSDVTSLDSSQVFALVVVVAPSDSSLRTASFVTLNHGPSDR